jgi:hypothetical protein
MPISQYGKEVGMGIKEITFIYCSLLNTTSVQSLSQIFNFVATFNMKILEEIKK